jgi:hypothetical protein
VSWEAINLGKLEDRPPVRPELGSSGLLYRGKRHVLSGEPESAKSTIAYIAVLDVVRGGGNVIVIDFESGQWEARNRFSDLGAVDGELDRVIYFEPDVAATADIVDELIDEFDPQLVVVDAAAGAFALQGLNENDRQDVETFASVFVAPFWRRDVATLVLDHVVKRVENRGSFVIGSERKVGGADVHLSVETKQAIRRGGHGIYRIATKKDRGGYLGRPTAATLELVSDPDTHVLTWAFQPATGDDPEAVWMPTGYMERVSRKLELTASQPRDAVTRNEVERQVGGKANRVREAVDHLLRLGYLAETAGTSQSRPVYSVQPYRETTASQPRPNRVPDAVPAPSSNRVPASPP